MTPRREKSRGGGRGASRARRNEMGRRRSIRTAVLLIATVAVLTAAAAGAGAMPVEEGEGGRARPLRGAALVHLRSSERSAWSTIAAASEAVGGVVRAAMGGSSGEVTEGALRSVVTGAVSCALRVGWMVTKGVPLPRAAAGVAVENLISLAGNENDPSVERLTQQAGTIDEVDSERTPDADSR